MSTLLEFDRVSKRFGSTQVLDTISLTVAAGERVGLVGLNGAGKTTLMRALLDLNRIDQGSITIDGMPHTETASRAGLSFLVERFSPPEFATGYETLRHLLALHQQPLDRLAVAREADALGLDINALDQTTKTYSKGMAQKLGLIACVLSRCPLLVLDEPMSGLDPQARVLLKRRIARMKADGIGVFFSTHLIADIDDLCDRLAIVHRGRLIWSGTPAGLLAEYPEGDLERAFLSALSNLESTEDSSA